MITQQCSKCKTTKSTTDFYSCTRNSSGYRSWCKSCVNLDKNERRYAPTSTTSTCCSCRIEKPIEEFSKRKSCSTGVDSMCRDCRRLYRLAHKRPITLMEQVCSSCGELQPARSFTVDSKRVGGISNNCKTCTTVIRRRQRKNNSSSYLAQKAKRRAASINATVEWADDSVIKNMYVVAKELSEATGEKYEVDHIIPLNHPLVCGLHVENNLQVIPKTINAAKSNKFTPGLLADILSAQVYLHTS